MAVTMPLKSNPRDIEDALKVIDSSGINHVQIDLTETHQILFEHIQDQLRSKGEWVEGNRQLGDANLRARLRMSSLYTIATNYNYLVVGTDNASRSEEHTSELQSRFDLVCRLLLEKKKK